MTTAPPAANTSDPLSPARAQAQGECHASERGLCQKGVPHERVYLFHPKGAAPSDHNASEFNSFFGVAPSFLSSFAVFTT